MEQSLTTEFPTFYRPWMFITMIIRVHHLSLSIQSTLSLPSYPLQYMSNLPSHPHLCLHSNLPTKALYSVSIFPMPRTSHYPWFWSPSKNVVGSTNHEAIPYALFSSFLSLPPLRPKNLPQHSVHTSRKSIQCFGIYIWRKQTTWMT